MDCQTSQIHQLHAVDGVTSGFDCLGWINFNGNLQELRIPTIMACTRSITAFLILRPQPFEHARLLDVDGEQISPLARSPPRLQGCFHY